MVFRLILGFIHQGAKCVGTVFFQKFIRILCSLHPQDPDAKTGFFQNGNGPAGRHLAGFVTVVGQNDLLGILGQEVGMFLRQCRAQGRHSAVEAVLVQGNGIHIALCEDDALFPALFCHIEGKQILPLIENDGFGGIEVLGFGVIQHPAAEADDIAPDIDDGEHESVAEGIINRALLLMLLGKTCRKQFFLGEALCRHGIDKARPCIGSVAKTEIDDRIAGKAAFGNIIQSRFCRRCGKLAVEKTGRFLAQGPKPLLSLIGGAIGIILRDLKSRPLGKMPHGIGIVQGLHFHDEIDDTAALLAAEAVAEALIRRHGEGRGLFAVEGAQAPEVLAFSGE